MGTVTDITNRPRRPQRADGPSLPFGPRRAGAHKPAAPIPLAALSLSLVGRRAELELRCRASCGCPVSISGGTTEVAATLLEAGGEASLEVLRQILAEFLKEGSLKNPCPTCLQNPGPGLA